MYLSWIKKSLNGNGKQYRAGEMHFSQDKNIKTARENMKSRGMEHAIEFINFDNAFRPYVHGDNGTILIIRFGGIGDIMALSSLRNIAPNHMQFITQEKYFPIFDWWEKPPQEIINITGILYNDVDFAKWYRMKKTIRRFNGEGLIEKGDRRNWYELFFAAARSRVNATFCRPRLINYRPYDDPSNIDPAIPSIVICPRATANMRSMPFEPIYKAILRIIGNRDINLYLHEVNSTDKDRAFIQAQNDSRIKLIKPAGIKEFLLDLFDCSMTISVDTAAIHFREGIEKPGIGIYSSFTTGSRTKHYRFTHSFDVLSPCKVQPCFMHQSKLYEVCQMADEGSYYAPCLEEKFNPYLMRQLVENMQDYLNSNL